MITVIVGIQVASGGGLFGNIGGMIGGAVGGMFGGPIGKMIGSQIGSQIGQMFGQMISQFGQDNVAGGLSNSINHHAANIANQHVDHCGMPRFIQDEMRQFIGSWLQGNMQTVPSDCQNACDHVYDHVMNSHGGGNNCTRTDAGGGMSLDQADINSCNANNQLDEEKTEGKGGNWLVELARALAKIQTDFLDKAMDNLKTMENNSAAMDTKEGGGDAPQGGGDSQDTKAAGGDSATGTKKEASRGEFMRAQSEFQANFQMFNMIANMTATSLKSLGEGLTAIARKQ